MNWSTTHRTSITKVLSSTIVLNSFDDLVTAKAQLLISMTESCLFPEKRFFSNPNFEYACFGQRVIVQSFSMTSMGKIR